MGESGGKIKKSDKWSWWLTPWHKHSCDWGGGILSSKLACAT